MPVWVALFEHDLAMEVERVRVNANVIEALPYNSESWETIYTGKDYDTASRYYRKFISWMQRGAHGIFVVGGTQNHE